MSIYSVVRSVLFFSSRRRHTRCALVTGVQRVLFRSGPVQGFTRSHKGGGRRAGMRGYFGIGVEGVSKPMNLGALLRTGHAFGASFAFTIAATFDARAVANADTSDAIVNLPFHTFPDVESLSLPAGCRLVGLELVPDAIALPSFRHPRQAAYVLGAERSSLSP